MTRQGVRYALGALALTALAVLVGLGVAGPEGRAGVLAGAATALLLQVASFWVLAVLLFPARPLLVFGLGMVARLVTFALAILLLIPAFGLPLAPTLLTLVTVFLLTTLLEPVVLQPVPGTGS